MAQLQTLETLIKSFSPQNLVAFIRAASGTFKPMEENLTRFLAQDLSFKDLRQMGRIEFNDIQRLLVASCRVEKELTSRSSKRAQYDLIKRVLKQGERFDGGLFAFFDANGHFRLSLVLVHAVGTRREFTSYRRYTYFVSPEGNNRTFLEQVGRRADFSSIDNLIQAFSVEAVTKDFFKAYERLFREAEDSIKLDWNNEEKRIYTQRFFNRIVFLAFLERKNWLLFQGRNDYLKALFEDYLRNDTDKRAKANFHRKRLNTLFFWGLNNSRNQNELDNPDFKILRNLIGDVPYLNGGLFEKEGNDELWFFPDVVVGQILKDLVYRFNFTVAESTPVDIEVAVDPEMLGKMFEELVTGRHETGSYYTPKEVVSFMCREALKGYLQANLPSETKESILQFVDHKDPTLLRKPEEVLATLRQVRACDPACGSGAYLLGLLHELLDLRSALFETIRADAQTVYERKMEMIRHNIYGVDIDPFAVNIARLRLWLSLIVDYEGTDPPPLPNLDYKIETGDSLTAPDPSGGLELGFRSRLVNDFLAAKERYITSHDADKSVLRAQIDAMREDIRLWSGRAVMFDGFDWAIEFAEVFVKPPAEEPVMGAMAGPVNTTSGQLELSVTSSISPGFDILLANPPYVRADAQFKHILIKGERQEKIVEWKAYRGILQTSKIYRTLYEKWDLYVPFLERAYQLLSSKGQMVYIISDAYNIAKYANKSRDYFLEKSQVVRIDFCSEMDLFDAGVNNTILHIGKTFPKNDHIPIRARRWGKRSDFEQNFELLSTAPQQELGQSLFRLGEIHEQELKGFVPLEKIFYVSYGLRANADDRFWQGEFVTEDLISDKKDKIHSKPFVEGKDLDRWWIKRTRYLEWGTKRAPEKFARPTFVELHNVKPKLMALVISLGLPPVVYDSSGHYTTHTSCIFVPWLSLQGVINRSINKTSKYLHQDPLGDRENREETSKRFNIKYLLAIMNSKFAHDWLSSRRRSKNHIYPDDWKPLPIAPISAIEQIPFVNLVESILGEFKKHGRPLPKKSAEKVGKWEAELEKMVATLYGHPKLDKLTHHER
ncbi:MAG: DNA methyltransferase [Anaerolineales bacterium]